MVRANWQGMPRAIPQDPHAFFNWFFKQQQASLAAQLWRGGVNAIMVWATMRWHVCLHGWQGWGLAMYEQDWMCTEYDDVGALQSNISLADMWLAGAVRDQQSATGNRQS
jgi:hypothetical protein